MGYSVTIVGNAEPAEGEADSSLAETRARDAIRAALEQAGVDVQSFTFSGQHVQGSDPEPAEQPADPAAPTTGTMQPAG